MTASACVRCGYLDPAPGTFCSNCGLPADPNVGRLKRQLALAVKSNQRMRTELALIRRYYQRKLRVANSRTHEQKERAEMWKHRALNP